MQHSKQKVIIVCGLPGSGKTVLAAELSKKLNLVCLHKDSLKEQLYELLNFSTLEDSKMIGSVSMNLLLSIAEEQLERGVSLILEAPFNFEADYERIQGWELQYKCDLYTIICSINDEERLSRITKRPRHAAHHDTERKHTIEGDDNQVYTSIPGKHVRVITYQPLDKIMDEILREIE